MQCIAEGTNALVKRGMGRAPTAQFLFLSFFECIWTVHRSLAGVNWAAEPHIDTRRILDMLLTLGQLGGFCSPAQRL